MDTFYLAAVEPPAAGDGWFAFGLALLNVVQTLALAYLAASRRRGSVERSERSRSRQTASDGRESRRS